MIPEHAANSHQQNPALSSVCHDANKNWRRQVHSRQDTTLVSAFSSVPIPKLCTIYSVHGAVVCPTTNIHSTVDVYTPHGCVLRNISKNNNNNSAEKNWKQYREYIGTTRCHSNRASRRRLHKIHSCHCYGDCLANRATLPKHTNTNIISKSPCKVQKYIKYVYYNIYLYIVYSAKMYGNSRSSSGRNIKTMNRSDGWSMYWIRREIEASVYVSTHMVVKEEWMRENETRANRTGATFPRLPRIDKHVMRTFQIQISKIPTQIFEYDLEYSIQCGEIT